MKPCRLSQVGAYSIRLIEPLELRFNRHPVGARPYCTGPSRWQSGHLPGSGSNTRVENSSKGPSLPEALNSVAATLPPPGPFHSTMSAPCSRGMTSAARPVHGVRLQSGVNPSSLDRLRMLDTGMSFSSPPCVPSSRPARLLRRMPPPEGVRLPWWNPRRVPSSSAWTTR